MSTKNKFDKKRWIDKQLQSNVIDNEIPLREPRKRDKYQELSIAMLHAKGTWGNTNKIFPSVLKDNRPKMPKMLDWFNKETLTPTEQQRVTLDRLMANPTQEIKLRTAAHAKRDERLWTPHVFRNEGGNLMSSIAGAGANKFHEFRQIRRNDLDREQHFDHLRNKEKQQQAFNESKEKNEKEAAAKNVKNARKRKKAKENAKRKKQFMREEEKKMKLEKRLEQEKEEDDKSDESSDEEDTEDQPSKPSEKEAEDQPSTSTA